VNDNTNTCSDTATCTDTACVAGVCTPTPVNSRCDDLNVCTDDSCNPALGDPTTGCYFENDNTNTCTDSVTCTDTACVAGYVLQLRVNSRCDDNNDCTDDLCDTVEGCLHDNLPPGTPCDGGYCTESGQCEFLPGSMVTDSSLCTFDMNSGQTGDQFNLNFQKNRQPANTFKLVSSNPGQFYYNTVYDGPGGSMTVTLPYPFVTQGATPIHVYSGVTISQMANKQCLVPGSEITGFKSPQITLSNYPTKSPGATNTFTINNLPAGKYYVNIHLDYGLKATLPSYTKSANNAVGPTFTIFDLSPYTFSDPIMGSDTVQNNNRF